MPRLVSDLRPSQASVLERLLNDRAEATAILRAVLAADERGQGQPFGEAMDRARAFVEGLG